MIQNDTKFRNCKEETILGVIIDNKLSFDSHIDRICKKVGQKLSALSAFTDLNKRQILFQSMIKSQFMFCSRKSDKIIKKIHQRSLRMAK